MGILEVTERRLRVAGWLSISTMFFDSGCTVNVFNSGGNIAYSPSEQLFFAMNSLDSTNTIQIQSQFAVMGDPHYVGQQQILTTLSGTELEHVSYALYAHARSFGDREGDYPVPAIPTEAELTALTPDPETKLYSGMDIVHRKVNDEISTIPIYPDDPKYYSGAIIDGWKKFYEHHAKFLTLVSAMLGCSDVI